MELSDSPWAEKIMSAYIYLVALGLFFLQWWNCPCLGYTLLVDSELGPGLGCFLWMNLGWYNYRIPRRDTSAAAPSYRQTSVLDRGREDRELLQGHCAFCRHSHDLRLYYGFPNFRPNLNRMAGGSDDESGDDRRSITDTTLCCDV